MANRAIRSIPNAGLDLLDLAHITHTHVHTHVETVKSRLRYAMAKLRERLVENHE